MGVSPWVRPSKLGPDVPVSLNLALTLMWALAFLCKGVPV